MELDLIEIRLVIIPKYFTVQSVKIKKLKMPQVTCLQVFKTNSKSHNQKQRQFFYKLESPYWGACWLRWMVGHSECVMCNTSQVSHSTSKLSQSCHNHHRHLSVTHLWWSGPDPGLDPLSHINIYGHVLCFVIIMCQKINQSYLN